MFLCNLYYAYSVGHVALALRITVSVSAIVPPKKQQFWRYPQLYGEIPPEIPQQEPASIVRGWTQKDENPRFFWGFWSCLGLSWMLLEELVAVGAVCGELVSAMNSLVSGNFAGKYRVRARA
jgi:hypothetical protein